MPAATSPSANAVVEVAPDLPPVESSLTLLSYNVKRGERWASLVASVRRAVDDHRPDCVLLQEAPLELVRSRELEPELTGRSLFFAPFHRVDRPDRRYRYEQYGQLIASARRISNRRVVELPTVNPSTLGPGHHMQRIALYVELPLADGRTMGLVNVHNEPFARRRDRALQHEAILRAIDSQAPEIAVCCGDFNPTFSQRGEPGLRLLERHGFENALARRWRAVDTCLARGHREFTQATRLPLAGSDHRPVVFRLRL
jgi:endonuclease/exonuclease/phosphatase family metal-dependent hydrolase